MLPKMAILTNLWKMGIVFSVCGRARVGAEMDRQVFVVCRYNFHFVWGPL